jgi:hypothetical protein
VESVNGSSSSQKGHALAACGSQREPEEVAKIASAHPDPEGICGDNHQHPPLFGRGLYVHPTQRDRFAISLRGASRLPAANRMGERLTTTQAGLVMAASFRI